LKPNDIECPFYGTSIEEELDWLRKQGGMVNIVLKMNGKKTTKEILDSKGLKKRKPRNDKGKKREVKEEYKICS